jgi:hypothetical protein
MKIEKNIQDESIILSVSIFKHVSSKTFIQALSEWIISFLGIYIRRLRHLTSAKLNELIRFKTDNIKRLKIMNFE